METKYIDIKGIRTRYLEAGTGEPLLLAHGGHFGMYCSANDWDLNIEGFARSFHVFAVDKIGCGFTDNPQSDDEYTIGRAVEHVCDFINITGLGKVHLIGHSRGGYLATRLSLEQPQLVKSLTIVDSATLMVRPGPTSVYDTWEKEAALIEDIRERY